MQAWLFIQCFQTLRHPQENQVPVERSFHFDRWSSELPQGCAPRMPENIVRQATGIQRKSSTRRGHVFRAKGDVHMQCWSFNHGRPRRGHRSRFQLPGGWDILSEGFSLQAHQSQHRRLRQRRNEWHANSWGAGVSDGYFGSRCSCCQWPRWQIQSSRRAIGQLHAEGSAKWLHRSFRGLECEIFHFRGHFCGHLHEPDPIGRRTALCADMERAAIRPRPSPSLGPRGRRMSRVLQSASCRLRKL
mmetsp:Transcript_24748/g.43297  ORF Transcript_24748/g.43297 Transcript_24748/m.43297 type:complete len:245 (-) Transcript_24748:532-1266(-)